MTSYFPIATYQWSGEKPNKLKFSPNGAYLAISYDDDDVKILETTSFTLTHTLQTSHGKVDEIDWS